MKVHNHKYETCTARTTFTVTVFRCLNISVLTAPCWKLVYRMYCDPLNFTEWLKKMYTLFIHQYRWKKFKISG